MKTRLASITRRTMLLSFSLSLLPLMLSSPPSVQASRIEYNISGTWKGSFGGFVYSIEQNGNRFTWRVIAPANVRETGEGTTEGNNISASWSGTNGSGGATGTLESIDASGRATRITWSNGVVFSRKKDRGGRDWGDDSDQKDTSGRNWGDDRCAKLRREVKGGTMTDGYVGVVIAAMGDVKQLYCGGGMRRIVQGSKIMIGDCIKTGPDGRCRVQMADRDEIHKAGPSVINFATNTEMCFTRFLASFDDPPKQETGFQLMKGIIRKIFRGWGPGSSVSVRTGVTVCGIRGSEVVISYDPNTERVGAYVLEGLMDVTDTKTGSTKSLTNNQKVIVNNGSIGTVEPLSKKEWDSITSSNGIESGSTSGPKTAVELEEGYDRPGGEYVAHHRGISTPQACLALCRGNAGCAAFTWVKPNIQGPTGVCWMKGSLSRKVSNGCCVSGVVKAVKEDRCELRKTGAASLCFCQNSLTGKWYATSPGVCP